MSTKERLQEKLAQLSEQDLLWLEQQLEQLPKHRLSPEEKTKLWQPLIGMLDDAEAEAAFTEAIQRRPLTSRELDLTP